MLNTRLVNALKKVGATVEEDKSYNVHEYQKHFIATKDGRKIDWYTQENFNEKTLENDGRLYVGSVWSRHPDTDHMTDLFMDTYVKTVKGAVKLVQGLSPWS
jgi:hypothetical protein